MPKVRERDRKQRMMWVGLQKTLALVSIAAIGWSVAVGLAAEPDEVAAVLEGQGRLFAVEEGRLHGPGGQWLVEHAGAARFTLIGESHHNAETPLLTAALLHALQPSGYSAYVVESGPESTRLLMEAVAQDDVDAGVSLLRQFPFSIAFLDQKDELHTAAAALDLGYEVWGVDQEFLGSPLLLLHRLSQLSSEPDERARMDDLMNREKAALERFLQTGDQSGAFLLSASADDFAALAATFPKPDSEGARIVSQLRHSAEIYRAFAERRYYENNATRVELIKRNFLRQLQGPDGQLPERRALIKMGSVHAGRGRTPMHVYDIGNFAAELAFAQGGESFHVLVLAAGAVHADGTFHSWRERLPHLAPALDRVTEDSPMVFDLRPLRALLTQKAEKTEALADLQETALRYDALVVYPRFHPSRPIVTPPGQ